MYVKYKSINNFNKKVSKFKLAFDSTSHNVLILHYKIYFFIYFTGCFKRDLTQNFAAINNLVKLHNTQWVFLLPVQFSTLLKEDSGKLTGNRSGSGFRATPGGWSQVGESDQLVSRVLASLLLTNTLKCCCSGCDHQPLLQTTWPAQDGSSTRDQWCPQGSGLAGAQHRHSRWLNR